MQIRPDILAVARWPLGGIRTYMKYVYRHLADRYRVTVLALSTHEDTALFEDAAAMDARLVLLPAGSERFLFRHVFRELAGGEYSLVHSHGFISAFHARLGGAFSRVPHVLTVHGILEEKNLRGRAERLKRQALTRALTGVDVIYATGEDILAHLLKEMPALETSRNRKVVIHNGIAPELFLPGGETNGQLRRDAGIGPETFVIGFLGRFMPQKGFDQLIEAVELLERDGRAGDFHVVAVGTGDFRQLYKNAIARDGLSHRFSFFPFSRDVAGIYRQLDLVVMPSNWEACPLQPMEALICGIPVLASDCIGMREVVRDTPVEVFPAGDVGCFAEKLGGMIRNNRKQDFTDFAPEAARRFDVRVTADRVGDLFDSLLERKRASGGRGA